MLLSEPIIQSLDGNMLPLLPFLVEPILRNALAEDLGRAGDITTDRLVPAGLQTRCVLAARKPGRVSGLDVAAQAFRLLDPAIAFDFHASDGDAVAAGQALATLTGSARAILTAERVALNFLCRMSGIATATASLAAEIPAGAKARIVCTRKTTPGLRALEKYAVACGGGVNHRYGLDDAILIKDNHIAIAGGVRVALERARRDLGHLVKIEIEVDTLDQLAEVLATGGADCVLLDNMTPDVLAEAVRMVGGRMTTEASGTVTAATVAAIAGAGVDLISSGWITHSAPILDIGLDFEGDD
jgi:nicotinate-nucleotide pyrophosphorylase (carboxylating)